MYTLFMNMVEINASIDLIQNMYAYDRDWSVYWYDADLYKSYHYTHHWHESSHYDDHHDLHHHHYHDDIHHDIHLHHYHDDIHHDLHQHHHTHHHNIFLHHHPQFHYHHHHHFHCNLYSPSIDIVISASYLLDFILSHHPNTW